MTYEGGIRVPCFVQWPSTLKGGRKIDRIAAHIDVVPTLIDICGAARHREKPLDGISLLPLLRDPAHARKNRKLFFQCHRGLTPRRFQNCAVVTQQYKLVGFPGTFSNEDLATDHPRLELYDVIADCSETTDLASQRPDILKSLRNSYDDWFDDVRKSRNFEPGVIHIGNVSENPVHLCRYQDGNYRAGKPHGWKVQIERSGTYRVSLKRTATTGRINVRWKGQFVSGTVSTKSDSPSFTLSAGKGILDVWFVAEGQQRHVISDNSTAGDVVLELISG